ncbi:unnamed protein product [Clonostachys rosea f. rosea IK726]|uniref:Uncharacterized protein n=1 Tax=Clonostachys rosea f. rosea IK726 TaxID=1349383 RepID=A0ACA9UEZ5_BIOOC|nr:unnamed protein product [Clonostachys rosea f. rosea IK726]
MASHEDDTMPEETQGYKLSQPSRAWPIHHERHLQGPARDPQRPTLRPGRQRKGIKVSKDSEMIGSYAPSTDKQPTYIRSSKKGGSWHARSWPHNAISSFVDEIRRSTRVRVELRYWQDW